MLNRKQREISPISGEVAPTETTIELFQISVKL